MNILTSWAGVFFLLGNWWKWLRKILGNQPEYDEYNTMNILGWHRCQCVCVCVTVWRCLVPCAIYRSLDCRHRCLHTHTPPRRLLSFGSAAVRNAWSRVAIVSVLENCLPKNFAAPADSYRRPSRCVEVWVDETNDGGKSTVSTVHAKRVFLVRRVTVVAAAGSATSETYQKSL